MSGPFTERKAQEEAEAQRYAGFIRSGNPPGSWRAVNEDIVNRFSWTALRRIKERAWRIVGGETPR